MTDAIIHSIRISYDESDERVRDFFRYLKNENKKEELNGYYEKAQQEEGGRIYIEDSFGNEFSLVCGRNHNCTLRLRGM